MRNYVREVKERLGVSTTKAFLPLEPDLGQEDEVDWGTAMVVLQGQALKVKLAQNGPDNEPVEIATLIVPAASAPSFVNGLANALGQLEEQIKAKQGEMAEAVDGATNPN